MDNQQYKGLYQQFLIKKLKKAIKYKYRNNNQRTNTLNNSSQNISLSQKSMQFLRPSGQQPSFTKYYLQDPSLIQRIQSNKQKKKIVLYDLPQIEAYRKLNKPVVSQQKKRIIKQKLDLQQESLLQTKQREKRNQYFLNYSENPFIELSPHTKVLRNNLKNLNISKDQPKQQPIKPVEKQFHQQSQSHEIKTQQQPQHFAKDIVTQLNGMIEKKPKAQFIKMQNDFKNMMKNADLFSKKIIQISTKKQEFQFFRKRDENQQLIFSILQKAIQLSNEKPRRSEKDKDSRLRSGSLAMQNKQIKKESLGKTVLQQLPQNIMAFDQIIKIKQQNYFMKTDPHPQKALNIFKVSFNKNQKQIIGKQLLNKYNFSFTSMVQKLQKIKIPIYRDISRMARRISLGISTGKQDRFDYIDSYQLSFKTNALNFADLMSVASGRFTPQFVYKTTNFDIQQNVVKQTSQTSSQLEQSHIFYEDNTQNIGVRFHNKGQQQQQIINYLKLQYNLRQQKYKAQCQQYKQSIFSQLNMKQKLVSTTIQDKQLHGVINKSIKKQLRKFVNLDQRDIQIDRLIRMNKMNKNKNLAIKLQKILQAFDIKKKHDKIITKLGIQQLNDDFEQQKYEKDKIKLKKRSQVNNKLNLNKSINTNQYQSNITFNGGGNINNNTSMISNRNNSQINNTSKTPQKNNNINNTSKTPTKRTNNQTNSKTPQKLNNNYTDDNNKSTVKKSPLWKW